MKETILISVGTFVCGVIFGVAGNMAVNSMRAVHKPAPIAQPRIQPVTVQTPSSDCTVQNHTVVRGDNLWRVSKKYFSGRGYLYPLLADINKVQHPRLLPIGKVLLIPMCLAKLPPYKRFLKRRAKVTPITTVPKQTGTVNRPSATVPFPISGNAQLTPEKQIPENQNRENRENFRETIFLPPAIEELANVRPLQALSVIPVDTSVVGEMQQIESADTATKTPAPGMPKKAADKKYLYRMTVTAGEVVGLRRGVYPAVVLVPTIKTSDYRLQAKSFVRVEEEAGGTFVCTFPSEVSRTSLVAFDMGAGGLVQINGRTVIDRSIGTTNSAPRIRFGKKAYKKLLSAFPQRRSLAARAAGAIVPIALRSSIAFVITGPVGAGLVGSAPIATRFIERKFASQKQSAMEMGGRRDEITLLRSKIENLETRLSAYERMNSQSPNQPNATKQKEERK